MTAVSARVAGVQKIGPANPCFIRYATIPQWSTWACVTINRSIRSNPLPHASSAASRAAVPSGPASPSSVGAAATPQSTRVSPPAPISR